MTNFLRLDQLIVKPPTGLHGSGDRIALVTDEVEISYDDLNERANRVAGRLRELGLERGDRVLAMMHNRVEYFELYFALAKLGAVIVPTNYFFVPQEVDFLVEDSGARFVVSEAALADRLDHLRGRPEFAQSLLLVDAERDGWRS